MNRILVPSLWPMMIVTLILTLITMVHSPSVNAQESRVVQLTDLPPVPEDLKRIVDAHELSFLVGGERPSLTRSIRSTPESDRRFDAETQFKMNYSFDSRCRWEAIREPATADTIGRLAVRVRYTRIETQISHQIWLRRLPDPETFWDDSLIRHELDHVRISSDPRLTIRFEKAIRNLQRIELSHVQSEPVWVIARRKYEAAWSRRASLQLYLDHRDAKPFVKSAVQMEFDRLIELVNIRYRELDRVTDHGLNAIPAGGQLRDWLGAD